MKRDIPVHPFLFGLYFLATPLVSNISSMEAEPALRFFFFSILVTLAGIGVSWIVTRDLPRSAFICSLFWISLGVSSLPLQTTFAAPILPPDKIWILTALLFFVLLALFARNAFWKKIIKPSSVTIYLNIVGLLVFSSSLLSILPTVVQNEKWKTGQAGWVNSRMQNMVFTNSEKPDIYYVILDGYAREDVLLDLYGLDNSPFLDGLTSMGFFVAKDSHANYLQTVLSLASSLNMDYLDDQASAWGTDSKDRKPPADLIRHSLVRKYLEMQGYRTVDISSGYSPTEIYDAAEIKESALDARFSVFEQFWTLHSPFVALIPTDEFGFPVWGYASHRESIRAALSSLATVAQESGPKFVFAHILAPHPPFVLSADGSPTDPNRPYRLSDGEFFDGTKEEYLAGYPEQVQYINQRLMEILPKIIRESASPVVIILQGDHGPGLFLNWSSAEASCLWERSSIFNAIYLPEPYENTMDRNITPVNTFRFIFNELFQTEFPRLEDREYYSPWSTPYQFEDITNLANTSCASNDY